MNVKSIFGNKAVSSDMDWAGPDPRGLDGPCAQRLRNKLEPGLRGESQLHLLWMKDGASFMNSVPQFPHLINEDKITVPHSRIYLGRVTEHEELYSEW